MAEKVEKERLDVLLVEKGLANSRELAKAYIMAGHAYEWSLLHINNSLTTRKSSLRHCRHPPPNL